MSGFRTVCLLLLTWLPAAAPVAGAADTMPGARESAPKSAPSAPESASSIPGSGTPSGTDAAYAELKESRRLLDRKLRDLRGRLRGVKLPGTEAREVSTVLRRAYQLLKTPRLRAAFSGAKEVRRELRRVAAARHRLEWVEELLRAQRPVAPD